MDYASCTTNCPTLARSPSGSLFVVAHHLDRLGDVVLAPLGLTTKQWLLLAVVQRGFAERWPTLTEAAAYGSSRQNVKAIARGLESAGHLSIVPDPADRRASRLEVTGKVEVFATPIWRAREAAFFSFVHGLVHAIGSPSLSGS